VITIFPKEPKKLSLGGRVAEHNIQKAIAKYLLHVELQGKLIYFAVPNGGDRHIAVAAKIKAEGGRSGIPDLVLISKGKPYFLEVKSARGDLSDNQKSFFKAFDEQGINCALVRSVSDVQEILKIWKII